MKKILTNNIAYKLLSLFFAVIFWLIVVNIDDPEVTRTIQGIPVTTLDEEVITEKNQVYTILSGKEVTVTIKGPRSEVDKMSKDDFVAEAPFSEKSNVDAVPIYVKFRNSKYDKDCEISQKTMSMKLEIENIVTKTYEIEINQTSGLTSSYYLGKESIEPSSVTVSAPESVINQIKHVGADVDLSSHTGDFTTQLNIKYYTATGTLADMKSNVKTNTDTVNYTAKVYPVREVPLKFGTTGTVADGYELVEVTGEKNTLKIAGPGAEQIESIVFPDELINISGASSDISVSVDVSAQLPSGVFLCSENDSTMNVTAKIEKLVTSTYRIPISEIDKNNIPDGYSAEIVQSSINITLSGLQKYHDSFNVNNLNAYVDLKNTVEGNNEVIVKFTLPEGLRVVSEVRVNVLITKNNSNNNGETTTTPTGSTENTGNTQDISQ